MKKQTIPYGRQTINQDDIEAVLEVLKSPLLTQGPVVREFEEKLAAYCGAQYAVAVINGTAALYLANKVLNVSAQDKVITTPNTFLATANSIALNGGRPIFADIHRETFNIDPDKIETLLLGDDAYKGIIPVHFGGLPAAMEEIAALAQKYNLFVIEDACHALGGSWKDSNGELQKIGNCAYSDLTVFSFHPVKHITTGEGGAITTNNKELYERLIQFRSHGITSDPQKMSENHGRWYYEMQYLSFNFRITDIQCALGLSQLKKSGQWIKRRNEIINIYDSIFDSHPSITPQYHPKDSNLSYHLYIVQCEARDELYSFLHNHNIAVQVHYVPVHLQPYYNATYGYKKGAYQSLS